MSGDQTRAMTGSGRSETSGLTKTPVKPGFSEAATPQQNRERSGTMKQRRLIEIEPVPVAELVALRLEGFTLRQRAREERRAKWRQSPSRQARTRRPPVPAAVLESIGLHRRTRHNTDSLLAQFWCYECARLEVLYAVSLRYHAGQATAEYVLQRRAEGDVEMRKSAGGAA